MAVTSWSFVVFVLFVETAGLKKRIQVKKKYRKFIKCWSKGSESRVRKILRGFGCGAFLLSSRPDSKERSQWILIATSVFLCAAKLKVQFLEATCTEAM